MMSKASMRSLLLLAAAVVAVPFSVRAASSQGDETIRSSCVMVKAQITRRGAPPIASATGTGFFVASDLILTCNHCTRIPMPHGMVDANDVRVELDGGQFVSARVIARDPAHDLALLQVEANHAEKAGCKPLSVGRFSLGSGSAITIVGNFPEAIRVTRGELVARSVMSGFAMGSAKVRSGFSGGPVLDADGKVQGILSQRDDDNNSIFVRSDVILSLLSRYGRPVAPPKRQNDEVEPVNAVADAKAKPSSGEEAKFQPASENTPKATEKLEEKSADAAAPIVVALPVRPTTAKE